MKYQLPSEDLDSLISLTTDEDLEHMIDECNGISDNSKIRLFLFPRNSESVRGSLLSRLRRLDRCF